MSATEAVSEFVANRPAEPIQIGKYVLRFREAPRPSAPDRFEVLAVTDRGHLNEVLSVPEVLGEKRVIELLVAEIERPAIRRTPRKVV